MITKDSNMVRKVRHPEIIDLFDLFEACCRNKGYSIDSEEDQEAFFELIRKNLKQAKTPTMIHGKRVESMFSYLAASLGKCTLIKKEDSGDIFTANDKIVIPDYHLVLKTGHHLLVEVKNFHQGKEAFKEFSLKRTYLEGLKEYSNLMKIPILVATYWAKWHLWTLVSPDDFEVYGENAVISMDKAMENNDMSLLGDYYIGTVPPLTIRIIPKDVTVETKEGKIETIQFGIKTIELFCGGKSISDSHEQQIALALILYGGWKEDESIYFSEEIKNKVEYIEYTYYPFETVEGQGFEIIDTLSSIISRQYGSLTTDGEKVEKISPNIMPGLLGFVVPDDYSSEDLPLWRLHVKKSK